MHVLQKGDVTAVRPGEGDVGFRAAAPDCETLVFSIHTPLSLLTETVDGGPMQKLTDASSNSFAFGACYGLSQAGVPRTNRAGHEVQSAAGAVATGLLAQLLFPGDDDLDLFSSADRFIGAHAIEPGLSPLRVATAFGVSERKLQAAFQARGMTVVRAISTRRHSVAMMVMAGQPHLDLSAVATRSGFRTAKRLRAAIREFKLGAQAPAADYAWAPDQNS